LEVGKKIAWVGVKKFFFRISYKKIINCHGFQAVGNAKNDLGFSPASGSFMVALTSNLKGVAVHILSLNL